MADGALDELSFWMHYLRQDMSFLTGFCPACSYV